MSARTRLLIGLALVAVVFLALRLPGIGLPYHQDEWKNVASSATVAGAGQFFAHPPFMQMLFVLGYKLFGVDYFRVLPLLFSIGAVILLYFVMKRRVGQTAAIWSAALFSVCFYNILGALQPDVDGAILPFLFLLAVYFYDNFDLARKATAMSQSMQNKNDYNRSHFPKTTAKLWFSLLVLTLLAGFLVKLSFILVVGAFIADWLWENRRSLTVKRSFIGLGGLAAFGVVYVALLYLIQAIYPAFSVHFMLTHANQFADVGRDWVQIFVQSIKALYYLSPLLIVPLLFISKDVLRKTKIFWIYLIFGLIFYLVLFDFSRAALDKYLMFAIVPLAAIVSAIFSEGFAFMRRSEKEHLSKEHSQREQTANVGLQASALESRGVLRGDVPWRSVIIGVIIAIILVALNFLPQEVVALYPKTAWFSRVLHLHWNVLTPMNGGSGPLGFYMSFLFIAGSYIVSAGLAIVAFFKKSWRVSAMIVIVLIGLAYNLVFAEELLLGKLNGSAPAVLVQTTAFIANDSAITQVITYNDIGAGPLSQMSKYAGRIYATPAGEEGYRKKFTDFNGQYLVIDIPRFDPNGFYYRFFAQCHVLFEADSGKISGKVYDCPHDPATMSKL